MIDQLIKDLVILFIPLTASRMGQIPLRGVKIHQPIMSVRPSVLETPSFDHFLKAGFDHLTDSLSIDRLLLERNPEIIHRPNRDVLTLNYLLADILTLILNNGRHSLLNVIRVRLGMRILTSIW